MNLARTGNGRPFEGCAGRDEPTGPLSMLSTADHTLKNLDTAHSILSGIEARLFGPAPHGEVCAKGSAGGGLEQKLSDARVLSDALVARLESIVRHIGAE